MLTYVFLHVLFVFVAFALTTGVGLAAAAIGASAEPRAILAGMPVARRLTLAGQVVMLVGILFGFGAAHAMQIPLSAPWLIAAYILAAGIFAIGGAVHRPWQLRLLTAAQASPDTASDELRALARDRAAAIAGPVPGL